MSISEDDLIRFHQAHFGFLPDRELVSWDANGDDSVNRAGEAEQPDVYYEDGTVRTITDEEIKFFRDSELRQRELARQLKTGIKSGAASNSGKDSESEFASTFRPASVEETKPYTPISNDSSSYRAVFGLYESYIQRLDDECDANFINVCRKRKVQHYYPVLPLSQ
ncbi:hypothetical protein AWJ20_512 [Sugiyamaella lignohabitans]|uniref:Uncharacterized protein n=1 Tax=Sugiyamaella lignohabitans TaxID=796027 RepID=A0A167CYM8_9ASCO|nr:uncharacterized protein AWJ20_512 [Sugiyamaella lignohabitans]ANB12263.1 hypothetical protein AWJ20_512 [Sugiyamaella lignohabitans]